jgi:hypothetical protein
VPKQYKIVLTDEEQQYIDDKSISIHKFLHKTLTEAIGKDKKNEPIT